MQSAVPRHAAFFKERRIKGQTCKLREAVPFPDIGSWNNNPGLLLACPCSISLWRLSSIRFSLDCRSKRPPSNKQAAGLMILKFNFQPPKTAQQAVALAAYKLCRCQGFSGGCGLQLLANMTSSTCRHPLQLASLQHNDPHNFHWVRKAHMAEGIPVLCSLPLQLGLFSQGRPAPKDSATSSSALFHPQDTNAVFIMIGGNDFLNNPAQAITTATRKSLVPLSHSTRCTQTLCDRSWRRHFRNHWVPGGYEQLILCMDLNTTGHGCGIQCTIGCHEVKDSSFCAWT
eukprot:1157410-Pelagomonas_calceolata.AAC.9